MSDRPNKDHDDESQWQRLHAWLSEVQRELRIILAHASVLPKDEPDVAHLVALLHEALDSCDLMSEAVAAREPRVLRYAMTEGRQAVERALLIGAIWELEGDQ